MMRLTAEFKTYTYGAAGRPSLDWRCRSMPLPIAELSEFLWKRLYHHLSPASRVCPPTGCQVLLFASSLKSYIGAHKDNRIRTDGGKQTRTSTDKSLNSHIFGTSVIVFSLYDEMEFGLLTPKTPGDYTAKKMDHVRNKSLTVCLVHRSSYILDPQDDENYMHSARFAPGTPPGKVRVAFVFRWLSKRCPFYVNKSGPLQYAYFKPDGAEALAKTKFGHLWIKELGLK